MPQLASALEASQSRPHGHLTTTATCGQSQPRIQIRKRPEATLQRQPSGNLELCSQDMAGRLCPFTEARSLRTDLVSALTVSVVLRRSPKPRRKMIWGFSIHLILMGHPVSNECSLSQHIPGTTRRKRQALSVLTLSCRKTCGSSPYSEAWNSAPSSQPSFLPACPGTPAHPFQCGPRTSL